MAQATTIEWTDVSWNPVHGCSKVSAGCQHCYAETLSLRYGHTTAPWTARNAEQNVMLKPHKLREPLSKAGPWKQPCRVFVNSMSDLFHEQIPDEYIQQVFDVMTWAPQHTFQVLTKRPERMRDWVSNWLRDMVPPSNIWLGTSIESRKWVGRADVLRDTPAAVRFISAEPLLGPLVPTGHGCYCFASVEHNERPWRDGHDGPALSLEAIDWLIIGGESGPGHRPFDLQWARDLRDAAGHCGTAVFVKQLGGMRPGTKLEDLPANLRIRQYPAALERVA